MARSKSSKVAARKIGKSRAKGAGRNAKQDIIRLILADHKPLKQMIKILKGEKAKLAEKKSIFEKFAPALIAHAKPEEQTWYVNMKKHDMSVEGTEGDVEHGLADQLCEELKATQDHDMFMAKVKVLAELVEHHIKEEEEELLPEFKKESSAEERRALGEEYLSLQGLFKQGKPALSLKSVA